MLLILLSWIYILIILTSFGILFRKIFVIKNCHFSIHLILGLFFYAIISCFTAIFIRLNIEYYLFSLLASITTLCLYRNKLKTSIKEYFINFKTFDFKYKLLFILLLLITCAQSATKPYLIDNESYYIQTIKWINEYGYIKGLANIHMFLGQNSVWHTLQAAFNFSFFTDRLNDLNGFVFLVMAYFYIEKLNNSKSNKTHYATNSILLFTLFFMQFINAPSPDLIIFLITPYIFNVFIFKRNDISIDEFKIVLSLSLLLCFVKVTMILLAFIVLILFIKNYDLLKKKTPQYFILCSVILILFITKNSIISGYLLYPTTVFNIFDFDWKLPIEILEYYKKGTYLSGMGNVEVYQLSFLEKIMHWLTIPKLHGLFNKIYITLLLLFPFIIFKSKDKFGLTIIYILAILQLVLLWNNSPQYRFFFVYIIILSLHILRCYIKKQNIILTLIFISVLGSAIPVFLSFNLNTFTNNKFAINISTFSFNNIITPEKNSKITTEFSKENEEDFEYNSPSEDVFFWATGNGDLPCVNKKQIEYIKYYYKYVPQNRGAKIEKGFKSVLIKKD